MLQTDLKYPSASHQSERVTFVATSPSALHCLWRGAAEPPAGGSKPQRSGGKEGATGGKSRVLLSRTGKAAPSIWKRRRRWHPTPVLLPGEAHGRRSQVGCSPWGRSESDRTERLHFHFSPSCIGEGNGNLLQYSCLENPRDRGAWWAAVYGVTQSWTQLK